MTEFAFRERGDHEQYVKSGGVLDQGETRTGSKIAADAT